MRIGFRKRIKIFPGFYLNIGKTGISASAGVPGARVTVGKKGARVTAGIPGSGLTVSENFPASSRKRKGVAVALINCSECNKEISSLAATCPNCGAPVQTAGQDRTLPVQKTNWKRLIWVGVIVLAVLAISRLGENSRNEKAVQAGFATAEDHDAAKAAGITDPAKFAEFKARDDAEKALAAAEQEKAETEAKAEAERVIVVSAVELSRAYDQNEAAADAQYKDRVLQVSGTVDSITKDFTDETGLSLRGANLFQNVQVDLEESEEQKAIALRKGQKVVLQCKGGGEVISSPMLHDCVLL